jgi:hypothetical protein
MRSRFAKFREWIRESKLRRFAALLVLFITFDQLAGYAFHGVFGWPRQAWGHSIGYGVFIALMFTVLSGTTRSAI